MLVIRSAQIAAMEQTAWSRAERELLGHLREAFQRYHALVGDAPMLEVLRLAVSRAAVHGHDSMREVFLYATLMLMLGAYFDEDPQLPWLVAAMRDVTHAAPPEQLDDAHAAAMQYLDAIAGAENQHLVRALVRMRDFELAAAADAATDETGDAVAALLAELYPEKARRHGSAAMRQAAVRGRVLARQHAMHTAEGIVLFSALVFMLGWRFHEDPQYPWAQKILGPRGELRDGPADAATVAVLHEHALAFLRYGLGTDAS